VCVCVCVCVSTSPTIAQHIFRADTSNPPCPPIFFYFLPIFIHFFILSIHSLPETQSSMSSLAQGKFSKKKSQPYSDFTQ
jgi:hypothetical protein